MDQKIYWENGNLKKEGQVYNDKATGLWTPDFDTCSQNKPLKPASALKSAFYFQKV
jgi:hypothetical protein